STINSKKPSELLNSYFSIFRSLYFSFTILSKLYIKFLISYNVKVAPFSSKYSYLSFSTNNDNSNGIQLSKSSLLCFKSRKEFAIKFKFIFTFFSSLTNTAISSPQSINTKYIHYYFAFYVFHIP